MSTIFYVILFICIASFFVIDNIKTLRDKSSFQIVTWIFKFVLLLGFSFLIIYFSLHWIDELMLNSVVTFFIQFLIVGGVLSLSLRVFFKKNSDGA